MPTYSSDIDALIREVYDIPEEAEIFVYRRSTK